MDQNASQRDCLTTHVIALEGNIITSYSVINMTLSDYVIIIGFCAKDNHQVYRIYSKWDTNCENQILRGAIFRNMKIPTFLLTLPKFVWINKGEAMLKW